MCARFRAEYSEGSRSPDDDFTRVICTRAIVLAVQCANACFFDLVMWSEHSVRSGVGGILVAGC